MNTTTRFLTILLCCASAIVADAQVISTFPYAQDFESFTLCSSNCGAACALSSGWTNGLTDQVDWTVFSGSTPTSTTGPSADHTLGTSMGKYLYVESSSPCTTSTAMLLTPELDLTGLSNLSMDFWYHLYGNNLGRIHVDVSTDGGMNFTDDVVPSFSQNLNGWTLKTVNLNAYAGSTIMVRIRGVTGTNSLSDIGIDDFTFYTLQGTDAGVININQPVLPLSAGLHDVAASIKNFGSNDLTIVNIGWSLNGMVQTPYAWNDTLTSGQTSSSFTIGSYNFPQGTTVLKVWTADPNGLTDNDNSNDTIERTYTLCAALSGTYTIGGSSPDFNNFIDAISSLNTCGVSGPVIFNVSPGSGPFFEQVTIPNIPGSSAVNTITFNGNGETISSGGSASNRHVIKLQGAKHIIIDDLNIVGTNISYAWGIHLQNFADSITIKNCVIDVSANTSLSVNNSAGIVASASTTAVNTAGNNASHLIIENNTIIGGFQGIRIQGQSSNSLNNRISGNTIRGFYSYGVYLSDCNNALVSGNNISRPNLVNVGTFYGVHLDARVVRTVVEKNKIHDTHNSAIDLSGLSHGISISNADASSGNENIVVNNIIYNFNSNGTIYGIYNSGSNWAYYYHNTISLDHANSTGGNTRGFYQTLAANNIVFKNNIVTVTRGGSGAKHCIYLADTLSSVVLDYNVYFVDTTSGFTGYWKGADYRTITDWQSANANAYDGNSVFANPLYASPGAGNLTPLNPSVDNTGQGVGVTNDIQGNVRDVNNPDAGAFEFTASSNDASLTWISPMAPVSAGSHTISVNLANDALSLTSINSASLSYNDGGTPVTQVFTGLNIPPGGNQNISFSAQYNLASLVTLKAYINSINGAGELVQANDTASQQICPALSGAYTINKSLPVSASNFQSFSKAASSLAICGVMGATTFNVTAGSGPYFEQVEIKQIPGSSSASPVIINGNGNTINANPTSANRHILRLNGADYVTLNKLVISGTDTSYGWGIHLYNQADHNSINDCVINFSNLPTATPDNFVGIVASASTSSISVGGNTANYTTITNCDVASKGYGIRLNGMNGGAVRGNKIADNIIRNFYSYGVHLSYTDSTEVSGNDIHRANRVNVGPFYGISLGIGCENTLIERNRIHNTHNVAASLTGSVYGIYFSDADAAVGKENLVINNLISNINGQGDIYAIYNSNSDNARYYHNTIILDGTAGGGFGTRGFFQELTAGNVDFRNNIVYIKRGGTDAKHCIYLPTIASTIASNNNVLFMNAPGFNNNIGRYGNSDFATLASWKTANGNAFDQNSSGSDPLFTDEGNSNYIPTNPAINDLGAGLGVMEDFYQDARSATNPDPGAFEFTPAAVNLDAAISWVAPVSPFTPGQKTITVNIKNLQSAPINQLVLSYTDGSSVVTQSFNALSIDSGLNQDISFTTTYNFTATTYLRAYIDSVNGMIDDNQLNDTTDFQLLCLPLGGNYTVNAGAPLSLNNFQSFTEAIDALVNCGISAPVVFDVVTGSGPYVEQIAIPFINGSSAVNTITFNGNNNTLSFSPISPARYVLMLNGAKHVSIQDLSILGTNTDYGYGVLFTNAADSNTISGCMVDVSAVTNTASNSNSCAILFSASTISTDVAGNNGSGNIISNNTVIGGHYGIRINGFTAAHNQFITNTIRFFYAYGIYLQDADGTQILGNDITRANRVDVTTFNGIYLSSGNLNSNIERNRIHNTHDNAANRSQASNAINFSNCDAPVGQENRVVNNVIYNLNSYGTIYGIFNTSSNGAYYYHNSISLDEVDTVGGPATGFYQSSFADNIDFRNNIVSVKRGGSGTKYCVVFASMTSNITCDYNIYYTPADASHFVGQFGTTNYATLAQWKTVSGNSFDQNSLFADPIFGSPFTGNLIPLNGSLDNKGIPLGITDDVTGAIRDTLTPDVGAFEFTPSQFDATVLDLIEPLNLSCASNAINVTAVISNFGVDTIFSTMVTAYITGTAFSDTLSIATTTPLANGQNDTVQLGTVNFTSGGTLAFVVFVSAAGDANQANDTVAYTVDINPSSTQPSVQAYNDSICTGSSTTITVTANPGLTYKWYDMALGGTPVHTGASFTTPALNTSTTYHVEATSPFGYNVGPVSNSIGSGGNFVNTGGQGLLFDVFKDITIDSLSVYVNDTGTVYVEVTGPANNIIFGVASAQVQNTGSKVTIPVGISLAPGSYRVDANGSTTNGLFRNDLGANYPYTVPGIISITGNTNVPANYFFFYDWKVTAFDCPSSRTAVPVYVDSTSAATAAFSYTVGGVGLDVSFLADDTSGGNSYVWDFGDGANDTGMGVVHQYGSDGNYTVCLTASNFCSQDTVCQSFAICGLFQNSFAANAFGQTVSFQFNGAGMPVSYLWDFGDSNTSTDASPSHTYQSPGTFTITLIAENVCGESDTSAETVTLCETVNADFSVSVLAPESLVFDFTSASTGNPVSQLWDFGDGTTDTNAVTTHTFPAHGSYNVMLILTDNCGGSDTMAIDLVTCLAAIADFSATLQADGKTVNTVNNSTGTNLTYNWNFGDGSTSTLETPTHTYDTIGTFSITLIINDVCGQSDTSTQDVSIFVGITGVSTGFDLSIFPNPTNGEFVVGYTLDKQSKVQLRLMNILGETIYENSILAIAGENTQKVSMPQLPKGVYMLHFRREDGVTVKRVVVK